MKKILSKHFCIFIVLTLVLQLFAATAVFANNCTFRLSDGVTELGGEVTVSLNIENNPAVTGVTLWLSYDKTMITPVSIVGRDFGNAIKSNIGQPGIDVSTLDEMSVVWYAKGGSTTDGVLCDITFRVSENAKRYIPITLIQKNASDVCDNDLNDIAATLVSGRIVVTDADAPDKTGLIKAIENAEKLALDEQYTADSIKNLKSAITAAKDVNESEIAAAEEVDAAVNALNEAILKLVTKMFYVYVDNAGKTNLATGYKMIAYGGKFESEVIPYNGYYISQILVNNEPAELVDNKLIISNLKENKNVTVRTAINKYSITAEEPQNGKITLSSTEISHGKSCVVTVNANDGYILKDLFIDGNSVGVHTKYTIENVTEPHTVSAEFEEIEQIWTVDTLQSVGGSITPKHIEVNNNGTAVFVVMPQKGYNAKKVIVNGQHQPIGSNNVLTLSNITENKTIKPLFEKEKYAVSLDCGSEGTANFAGTAGNETTVPYLDTVTVEIAPAVGYELKSIFVNGIAQKPSKGEKGTFICEVKVTDNTQIAVRFIKDVISAYKEKVELNGVPSDVTATNAYEKKAVFTALANEYETLNADEKVVCSGAYATVLSVLERANAYIMLIESNIEQKINDLPEANFVTLENEADVNSVKASYDKLTVLSKKLLKYDLQKKLDAAVAKIEKLKKESAEKLDYLTEIIAAVPTDIIEDNIGFAHAQLKKAEELYNSLNPAEKLEADSSSNISADSIYSKISTVMGLICNWYVNPFVADVEYMTCVDPGDTVSDAEAKRVKIYEATNKYDSFAGYVRELIPETTIAKLDKLYASASIVVTQSFEDKEIHVSGDIEADLELEITKPEPEITEQLKESGVAVGQTLDISLTDGTDTVQPNSKIRIKIPVDTSVAVGEPYVIYIEVDGDGNLIKYNVQARVVDEDGQKFIMWDTDHFSCYAIMYNSSNDGITFDPVEFPDDSDSITATVDDSVYRDDCTLYLAGYSSNNKLIFIKKGEGKTATETITSEVSVVKAMFWDKNLNPVAYAEIKNNNKKRM